METADESASSDGSTTIVETGKTPNTEILKKEKKKKLSTDKGILTRKLNSFTTTTQQSDEQGPVIRAFEAVQAAFNKLEITQQQYMNLLDSDTEEDEQEIRNSMEYMDELEQRMVQVNIKYDKIVKRLLETKNGENDTPRKDRSPRIKVERMKPPKFFGDIREFPTFLYDYERNIMAVYGEDPFVLRNCLQGSALEVVKGVEDDHEEMMKRLKNKYGDKKKLADRILMEVKRLTPINEGNAKKFSYSVEVIEKAWLDLKRMNMESVMDNPLLVGQLEKLLPSVQKREWILKANREKYGNKDMFMKLLEFMLEEKQVMEYLDADIRTSACMKGAAHSEIAEVNEFTVDDERTSIANIVQKSIEPIVSMLQQSIKDQQVLVASIAVQNAGNAGSPGGTLENQQCEYRQRLQNSKGSCWIHGNTNSHSVEACKVFQNYDEERKLEEIRKANACYCCLQRGHHGNQCNNKKMCGSREKNGNTCEKFHHPILHKAHIDGKAFHNSIYVSSETKNPGLLMVSKVFSGDLPLTVLWDPGANISLITHRAASKLGLQGMPTTLSVTGVGNRTEWLKSKYFKVELQDKRGRTHRIGAYGMDEVTAKIGEVDVSDIAPLLNNISLDDIKRPVGSVDVLIGTDACDILPIIEQDLGKLQLMRNQFGYCLRGTHSKIKFKDCYVGATKVLIHQVSAEVNNMKVESNNSLKILLDKFLSDEGLGISCVPKCGNCKCGQCPVGTNKFSIKEERELALIKEGLRYDGCKKKWSVKYPWLKDPALLPNNENMAVTRLKNTENRLEKLGPAYAQMYQDQFKDMIERGVARKLSNEEMKSYNGPVYYLTHHEVLKPESISTPCRIVFNSSACYRGHVLNDYWAKGPDIINNLFGILLRFRQEPVAIVGDIKKMFNAVELSLEDQHTHRIVWRNMNKEIDPEHYVLTAVTFGDRPSGIIASLALLATAENQKEDFPEVAEVIKKNSYVDDIVHSVRSIQEAKTLASQMEEILKLGGFHIKHWIIICKNKDLQEFPKNGKSNSKKIKLNILKTTGEKVLGMSWNTMTDDFQFQIKFNFSAKRKKGGREPYISEEDIPWKIPERLTKRMVLSQIATIFDPLGLVLPFTLLGKCLFRELCMPVPDDVSGSEILLNWDDSIPAILRKKWGEFFCSLIQIKRINFARCLKPENTTGNPILLIFSDGSNLAYGACAYIRWELEDGGIKTSLVAAKNRIAPIKQKSIPQLELCGALLGSRLRTTLVNEMDYEFSNIYHIVDSEIVRAQIQKESTKLDTFVATKIAEIQGATQKEEWWWVASNLNPADLLTRPTTINSSSVKMWKFGPEFLEEHSYKWPICQNKNETGSEILSAIYQSTTHDDNNKMRYGDKLSSCINIDRFSKFSKLIKVTARVMLIAKSRSFAIGNPTTEDMKLAEEEWIREVQKQWSTDWQVRFIRLGPTMSSDGIICVGKRIEKWLKDNWNKKLFILLNEAHPFTQLLIRSLHEKDHSGVESTLAKLQSIYWVPKARRAIRKIKESCVLCRKLNHKLLHQEMGQIPETRLQPSPPFYHTAVDLFGPFLIKDTVKRRTKGKAYGVIFNCLTSRAVYIDIADGYDTDSFLLVFRRFINMRGCPKTMYSDGGSQLMSANRELRQMISSWDKTSMNRFFTDQGMTWTITKSANAPWENGCSESLIKLVKKGVLRVMGENVVTFSEMQTILYEIGNLLNERPIGIKPNMDIEYGTYLCPNDLLLGRSTLKPPIGEWDTNTSKQVRLRFVQRVVESFWKRWQRDFFPTLIVRKKWHVEYRNVRKGDVVLVQDSNTFRGEWKLARVIAAEPGRDGKVRDVELQCTKNTEVLDSLKKEARFTNLKRSVHRLVLLLPIEEQ